jgi:hypothetical protein
LSGHFSTSGEELWVETLADHICSGIPEQTAVPKDATNATNDTKHGFWSKTDGDKKALGALYKASAGSPAAAQIRTLAQTLSKKSQQVRYWFKYVCKIRMPEQEKTWVKTPTDLQVLDEWFRSSGVYTKADGQRISQQLGRHVDKVRSWFVIHRKGKTALVEEKSPAATALSTNAPSASAPSSTRHSSMGARLTSALPSRHPLLPPPASLSLNRAWRRSTATIPTCRSHRFHCH